MSVDIGPRSSDVVNPTILLGARLNIDIPTELSGTFSALIGFSSGVAGLAHRAITPHTLCHTAITHLVQVGVDLSTVQCVSGHKSLKMVRRYAHHNTEHVQRALSNLDGRVSLGAAHIEPATERDRDYTGITQEKRTRNLTKPQVLDGVW